MEMTNETWFPQCNVTTCVTENNQCLQPGQMEQSGACHRALLCWVRPVVKILWRLCAPATGWEILVLDAPVLPLSWKGQKDSAWYSLVVFSFVLCCTDGQYLAKPSPGFCTSPEEVKDVVRWSCAKSWSFRFAGWLKQIKKKKKLHEFRLTKDGNVLLFWVEEKSERNNPVSCFSC